MAGAKAAARGSKRVEATVLKRSRDGSAFTRCEACNKDVPVVLIDMHSCSLDSKIRMTLEAQVVEKTVEINKTERKRPASSAAKGHKSAKKGKDEPKRKRSPSAFFLFMDDFRKEYKAAHPDNKSVATVGKEGGEKWRSMTEEEKKPYFDKVAELKAQVDNGEGSDENAVAVEKSKADDEEEQEVDQPAKPLRYESDGDEDEVGDQKDEEKNELDDDM
ncbi:high mobility group B protein 7-like [Phragmites australis]|uniref:high mobility group B protein 7-like n=1 Tax=Phragmites australis TaxID=29695 RepID=UPI002D76D15A|nr:high mobility group B protein 7-like [Phragmites australis]